MSSLITIFEAPRPRRPLTSASICHLGVAEEEEGAAEVFEEVAVDSEVDSGEAEEADTGTVTYVPVSLSYYPVGRVVTRSSLESRTGQIDTKWPMACHFCDVLKETVAYAE